jgi:hypothetical protein
MILTGTLYALHDALVKPMPAGSLTPSLAESWSMSPDGLVYDFVLRKGVKFHNGEPVTAEDVKFSFERHRGGFASVLKDHVAGIETANPGRVRIRSTRTARAHGAARTASDIRDPRKPGSRPARPQAFRVSDPRSTALGRQEHGAGPRAAFGCHEADRPQD